MKSIIIALCSVVVLSTTAAAQQPADSTRVARLAPLARVWGFAKYFHPSLTTRSDIRFDDLLIDAIRATRDARSSSEYAAAVQRLFDPLRDPLTRVEPVPSTTTPTTFRYHVTADSVVMVTLGNPYALTGAQAQAGLRTVTAALPTARGAIIDLRSDASPDPYARAMVTGTLSGLERLLASDTLLLPAELRRVYYGYESQTPFASGQYRTGQLTRTSARLVPAAGGKQHRTVVIFHRYSVLSPAAAALLRSGGARALFVGDARAHDVGSAHTIPLEPGWHARFRTTQPVFPDGESGDLLPDVILDADADSATVFMRALALLRDTTSKPAERDRVPYSTRALAEASYGQMLSPSVEYRLLALFRLWNVVEYFYPYKHLLDRDWGDVLTEFIPVFEAAQDERAYTLAIARLVTRMQDSHNYLSGALAEKYLTGSGYPGIRVQMIERQLVVTSVTDTTAIGAGIRPGDVVIEVDGEPAQRRYARVAELTSASTPQSRTHIATFTFLTGAPGTNVTLTLRDAARRTRTVSLRRNAESFYTLYHRERTGDIIRILPGNVGYVDLDRLTYDMIDSAFTQLRNTRGIIFDGRGYPHGTIWAIAPRLAKERRPVALFHTPMPGHDSPGERPTESFVHFVEPAPAAQQYRGRTMLLIDERTVSQAEHTGLFLKAANATEFVGMPTAGANGELATVVLPGAITVGFTAQSVSFPDGRQLQRVGLIPDHRVAPTIAGIRAGRDEVLERARQLMR